MMKPTLPNTQNNKGKSTLFSDRKHRYQQVSSAKAKVHSSVSSWLASKFKKIKEMRKFSTSFGTVGDSWFLCDKHETCDECVKKDKCHGILPYVSSGKRGSQGFSKNIEK